MKTPREAMNRRQFIQRTGGAAAALAATSCLAPSITQAQGLVDGGWVPDDKDAYDLLLPRICNNNPDWDFGPGGDKNLLEQFSNIMRCKVKLQDNVRDEYPDNGLPEHFNGVVDLTNLDTMRKFPAMFMMGTGGYDIRIPERLQNLKAYLEEGGFLLMDECASPRRSDQFYQSGVRVMQKLFEPDQIRRIPEDHEVYRNVYDISEPNFRRWRRNSSQSSRAGSGSPGNTGVFIGDRIAVIICDAEIHCGWLDPRDSWGKRANNHESIQTGINFLTYFMSH